MIELVTPPDLHSEAVALLVKHGCGVELAPRYAAVLFPEGTERKPVYPWATSEVYLLTLPDGYVVREVYDRFRGWHFLFLLKEECGR